ncbi:hypothetical protein GDO86_015207 [Hymenochirus boettgeri]|uniref:Uncharacterized protein n=1 Tax=Hymenochirus boettgeri TaxID=247094 RepID=A0A8T2JWZ3_9PIPI|nr:hypothetical protein GDO86_015207 [Hymenochirus boettgeri]
MQDIAKMSFSHDNNQEEGMDKSTAQSLANALVPAIEQVPKQQYFALLNSILDAMKPFIGSHTEQPTASFKRSSNGTQ